MSKRRDIFLELAGRSEAEASKVCKRIVGVIVTVATAGRREPSREGRHKLAEAWNVSMHLKNSPAT